LGTEKGTKRDVANYWIVLVECKQWFLARRARASTISELIMNDIEEEAVAIAAIERAVGIYQQMQQRDRSVILQARRILTQHIYGMVDKGERDEQRLTVSGLAHLKSIERDHTIRSAHDVQTAPAAAIAPTRKRRRATSDAGSCRPHAGNQRASGSGRS
jgi:hypothetical protein